MAAPAPVVPVGAEAGGGDPSRPSQPSADEQFFAPAVLQPVRVGTGLGGSRPEAGRSTGGSSRSRGSASSDAGKWILLAGMVVFVVAAVATAWFTLRTKAQAHETPVVLAPRAPTAGLPTSLDVIVRVEAESTRHTALQAVEDVGNGDPGALAARQPNYTWVAGDQPSTDSHVVSVAQGAGTITIAVAASNHDICAFGQWLPASRTPQYVTMAHQPSCAATNAPTAGWSDQAGGAASDLPDNIG